MNRICLNVTVNKLFKEKSKEQKIKELNKNINKFYKKNEC